MLVALNPGGVPHGLKGAENAGEAGGEGSGDGDLDLAAAAAAAVAEGEPYAGLALSLLS